MNPHSLPGMTQGARKRAARAIAMAEALRDDPDMPFWARNLTERPMEAEPRDRREALRYFHGNERTHDETVTYRIVRARYRIGERLHPCPRCPACCVCAICGQPAACLGLYEGHGTRAHYACNECCGHGNEDGWCELIGAVCEPCDGEGAVSTGLMSIAGDYHETDCPACDGAQRVAICDGTGVLPARRARFAALRR